VGYVTCPESETLGINTRHQLAAAETAFQTRARFEALENGVTLTARIVVCDSSRIDTLLALPL
jgi:bifunctional UDP-N-acetylglucosamine pyrophosphorylase/glucosamine-1-phosphate N-acetyltransferase